MTLPGRLTVGFLDEDNPLKSFFRMRPILTEEAGSFAPPDTDARFPEEGFIRIVPDKNEMTMFKVRMRQLGRYCALDLRKHLSENDKIRPNKNYIFGGPEHNQFIVYSDVIGRVPPHLIAEVLEIEDAPVDEKIAVSMPMPGTIYVMVKRKSQLSGPWSWSQDGSGTLQLQHALNQPFSELPEAVMDGCVMDVPLLTGGAAQLMYDLTAFELGELTAQEFERIVDSGLFGTPALNGLFGRDDRPIIPGVDSFRGMEQTIAPEIGLKAEGAPWLSRSELLRPRALTARLPLSSQALQAQSGLNPRRGRSLHEVVDEQWRKSRYDQLGHPVPGQAGARPIASPVERAGLAASEAWSIPENREALVSELLKNDELRDALCERLDIEPGQMALTGLAVQRDAVRREIDALVQRRDEAKAGLLSELQAQNAAQFKAHQQRLASLQSEIDANERCAKAAREAAELTAQMLRESKESLDERLKTLMLAQRLEALAGEPVQTHPDTVDPAPDALLQSIQDQMAAVGIAMTDAEAGGLLAALVSGSAIILSGPSGSGKTVAARALASALGLAGTGRFAQVREATDPAARALLAQADGITPLLLLIDDFNTGNCAQRMLDIIALQEEAAAVAAPLCLLLTAQDAPEGKPLSPRLLSRGFLVRLPGASDAAPFRPIAPDALAPGRAVSLAALRDVAALSGELPEALTDRLSKLRQSLKGLHCAMDRRTLSELWTYCAVLRNLMTAPDVEVLDGGLSRRAIPAMLASMEVDALHELPKLLADLPKSLALMDQPLPLPPF